MSFTHSLSILSFFSSFSLSSLSPPFPLLLHHFENLVLVTLYTPKFFSLFL